MDIFGSSTKLPLKIWGPNAGAKVTIDALGGVVGNTWFLTNMNVGAKEITDVRQCFNDVSFIYALGNNQSQCQITLVFVVMLGGLNCAKVDGTANIASGFQAYVQNRISQKTNSMAIGIGNFARKGWLTGIDVGQVDAKRSICYATVHFLMELNA